MKWEKIKFSALYAIPSKNGLTRPKSVRGRGYKMINMGELFANDRIRGIPMELVPMTDAEKIRNSIEKGDLLFARQSLVLEGAGKCCIVMDVPEYTTFESHLIRIRLNQEIALSNFYYYYFKSPLSPMKTIVHQCAQAGIRGSDLSELEVDYPLPHVQRRIADILSAYDDLIENNQKQIKLLEEAAMRLYKEWFVYLRFPGHEQTAIVDGVPEGWEKGKFKDICIQIKETVKVKDLQSDTPYIGLEHMPRKNICLSEWSDASIVNSNKFLFQENDVLFGKIRPYFHKVGFAITSGVASTDAMIFRAKEDMFGLLLATAFSDCFVKHTSTKCKEGSKMPRADWNEMKNFSVLIPAENVLREYDAHIANLCMKIKILCKQVRLLQQARDKLLPKLMSGEIEV